jgi:hypothetical protein
VAVIELAPPMAASASPRGSPSKQEETLLEKEEVVKSFARLQWNDYSRNGFIDADEVGPHLSLLPSCLGPGWAGGRVCASAAAWHGSTTGTSGGGGFTRQALWLGGLKGWAWVIMTGLMRGDWPPGGAQVGTHLCPPACMHAHFGRCI